MTCVRRSIRWAISICLPLVVGSCADLIGLSSFHEALCVPGSSRPCPYAGPPGTEDVGVCKAGSQACADDGQSWSTCTGEIQPAKSEVCSNTLDDDCNGTVNDGCPCTPGQTEACYSGPAETEGVGPCKGGARTCNKDGMGWGTCVGETVPQVEACPSAVDMDCSGYVCATTLWVKDFGDMSFQEPRAIAVDSKGSVIVAGDLHGSADFGGGALVSQGEADVFVAKLDKNGAYVWAKRFGDSTFDQRATAVAIDKDDNIIVAGKFAGTVDLGGGVLTTPCAQDDPTWCSTAGFVAKFNKDGEHIWSLGSIGVPYVNAVAADPGTGDTIVVGKFGGTIDFGAQAFALTATGGTNGVVARLAASNGKVMWGRRIGDTSVTDAHDEVGAVAIDPSGGIVIAGTFEHDNSAEFGAIVVTAGNYYLARYDATGGVVWARGFEHLESGTQPDLAVAPNGNIVMAGSFVYQTNLGGTNLTSTGQADHDLFVALFDPGSNHLWSKSYGDGDYQGHCKVATDPHGDVVLTAIITGSFSFGGSNVGGSNDVALAKLDSSGKHLWSRSAFGEGSTGGYYGPFLVATDSTGAILLTGPHVGTSDFGTGPIASSGQTDILIAKFTP